MLSRKKKNLKKIFFPTFILFIILIIYISLIKKNTFFTNVLTDIRILTCQPKFDQNESLGIKIKNVADEIINYLKIGCPYEELKIDIKFKNFLKLKKIRQKALKNNILIRSENDYVPAKVYWKNKKISANVRLKGTQIDHILQNKKWSLKVNLRNGEAINQFREFSLTKHSSRQFPEPIFFSTIFKQNKILTPNYRTVKVTVNGVNWGPMLMEEQFSDAFMELRGLKETSITKLSDGSVINVDNVLDNIYETDLPHIKYMRKNSILKRQITSTAYDLNKIIKKQNNLSLDSISIIKTIHEGSLISFEKNKKEIEKYIDLKQYAFLVAYSLVWNEFHSTGAENFRIYFNPFSQKINYIPTDFNIKSSNINLNSLVDIHYHLKRRHHFSLFLSNEKFQEYYIEALNILEKNLEKNRFSMQEICKDFISHCLKKVNLEDASKRLKRLKKLNTSIFNDIFNDKYEKYNKASSNFANKVNYAQNIIDKFKIDDLYVRIFDDGYIDIYNLTMSDINLKNIKIDKSKDNSKKCFNGNIFVNLKIPAEKSHKLKRNEFFIDKKICKFQKVSFETLRAKHSKRIKTVIESRKYRSKIFYSKKKEYNKLYTKENNLIIDNKELIINNPIIIKNKNLIIKPGTNIIFSKNSYIYIENGNIELNGTKENPIMLSSKDNWGGIYVYNSNFSKIENSIINNLKEFNHENIALTGSLNFYKSNILINSLKLTKSNAEDGLNIVKSNFKINNSSFSDMVSDAIDIDFSEGEINDVKINNISGDGVDLSGSKVLLKNIYFKNIKDKAISNGERSNTNIKNININDAFIGIANKDSSNLKGSFIKIKESKMYDVASFTKKKYYDTSKIRIQNAEVNYDKVVSQINHVSFINKKKIPTTEFDSTMLYE